MCVSIQAKAIDAHSGLRHRLRACLPLLVSTVDAYAQRPDVMHRVLPALAQLVALMPKDGSGSGGVAVEEEEDGSGGLP